MLRSAPGRPLVALGVALALLQAVQGVKLKFRFEECLTYDMTMYEPFYGSFVALPDMYGNQVSDLGIAEGCSKGTACLHDLLGPCGLLPFHDVSFMADVCAGKVQSGHHSAKRDQGGVAWLQGAQTAQASALLSEGLAGSMPANAASPFLKKGISVHPELQDSQSMPRRWLSQGGVLWSAGA